MMTHPPLYIKDTSSAPRFIKPLPSTFPVFIGHTKLAGHWHQPVTISSLNEFVEIFGDCGHQQVRVTLEKDAPAKIKSVALLPARFCLYHHIKIYYANGGGRCTIISAGRGYNKSADGTYESTLTGLLTALQVAGSLNDENLLVIPEATALPHADYVQLLRAMLAHCAKMPNRFAILDVYSANSLQEEIDQHREDVGDEHLHFAATYHPHLLSEYAPEFDVLNAICLQKTGDTEDQILLSEHDLRDTLLPAIQSILEQKRIMLPPCSAVAGAYVRMERERGQWKAPAGASLLDVKEPGRFINDEQQQRMNVDVAKGKSVNALRHFTGKGTLIWGTRTLDGNSNEWRFIPVRRLCSGLKKVISEALSLYVFDSNEVSTWQKVRSMTETFMLDLWKQGAFQGRKPEEAFYVRVGAGQTMTNSDVAEGRMIVEIGIAMLRPAEFILLRITQQLQQS